MRLWITKWTFQVISLLTSFFVFSEYNLRYEIFEENMEQVKLLNKYDKGTAKYGATRFADLTSKLVAIERFSCAFSTLKSVCKTYM